MASSELVQELIRAHVAGETERFRQIAMQVAAREARAGHRVVAGRIRDVLEASPAEPTPISKPPRNLEGFLEVSYPEVPLERVVLEADAEAVVNRLLEEHRSRVKLADWGLSPRRRVLFFGPPGCGKTMTASAIATELALPLFRIRVEILFSRYMGETASILAEVFDHARRHRGVYLFDEFDAIGKNRADTSDVGEARRIVSTFLQLLDGDDSESVLIAATNDRNVLDAALIRRFDDVAKFDLPTTRARSVLISMLTASYRITKTELAKLTRSSDGLSDAEITRAVTDAVKAMVLSDRKDLEVADVKSAFEELGRRTLTP